MKVTVIKPLNVRVGKPSVNAPCYQYLAPGSELEVDGVLYPGDFYENINTWLKDAAGNYYWSGGVSNGSLRSATTAPPFESLVDYNKMLKTIIPLPSHFGAGINVALLDSGVNVNHSDLSGAVVASQSFIQGLSATQDVWGHGTMMAGFIGGRASTKGIRGVAPECNLYNYRVIDDNGNTDMKALKNAFNFIITNQNVLRIKVINLSLSVSDLAFINTEINTLAGLGIKIIVAAGNQKTFKYGVRLLAQNTNTIGVGVVDSEEYIKNGGAIPSLVAAFYYDQSLYSCSSDPSKIYDSGTGDSIYTALSSGIVALLSATGNPVALPALCFNRNLFNINDLSPYS
jgi:Subtilase family